ncbi:MAG TPA: hypothetical protein ACFYD6_00355 [Candidatus Brocadiia bacterium]|nr:hypothetical protein [Candidatus Brocadiales bacterium]
MSFDWKDYVYLADNLLNQTGESYLRSSISRAYYGVFCIARNRKGYKSYTGQDNIHWKVINEYKSSSNKNEQNIGRILDKLRKTRNDADYDEDKPITKAIAQRGVLSAKQI